jgi:Holliday junction resolvase
MRRLGRTGHKDGNQDAIVLALRKLGASVAITSGHGYGLPDLIIGWKGETYMFEVKNRAGRGVKLSANEAYFIEHWRGRPVVIVESVEDALRALGVREP